MSHKYDCKYFTGYKPCKPGMICQDCKEYSPMRTRILLINLDALGDVLRTTSILRSIRKKYKNSFIVWLTNKNALPLLENNPLIDKVYAYSFENVTPLLCEQFDVLLNVDKSRRSASLANLLKAKEKFGFGLMPTGAIYPLNKEAEYLYNLGLNDEEKFKINKKSEQKLLSEAFALDFNNEEYILNLTDDEKRFVSDYRKKFSLKKEDMLLGINTGCSEFYPYKKLPLKKQVELIGTLFKEINGVKIALLGGKEDTENNEVLKDHFKEKIISTPTDQGLRKGILFIAACDAVISGDSLGLHIAIALKKPVVAWFSITCENEIDLYGRGVKITSNIKCRPCWQSSCTNMPKCNELVDMGKISRLAKSLVNDKK